MKKLLLAPFLLASLFSFGGELKAHPENSNSRPTPAASAERWYMVTIATQQRKVVTDFSDCPLRYYWYFSPITGLYKASTSPTNICDPTHNHVVTFSDWNDTEQTPIPPSNIAFKSLAECNIQARAIKRFYKSHPYDKTIYSHSHYTGETGTSSEFPDLYSRDSSKHEHSTVVGDISRFYFKHTCIPGTVDY